MKVILTTQNQQLETLLASDFFQELFTILKEKEEPTLREIKQNVTDQKIDWKIDLLVKEKIIQRQEKRYSLLLPIERREEASGYQKIKKTLLDGLSEWTVEDKIFALVALYPKVVTHPPFLLDETRPFSYYQKISNDLLEVISLSTEAEAFNLPNYFNQQMKSQEIGKFSEVEAVLGDVDPSYYLDQIWAVIEKIQNNRRRIRDSIFLKSMALFQITQLTDRWELIVPLRTFVEKNELILPFMEKFAELSFVEQRRLLGELMGVFDLPNMTIVFVNQ